MFCPQNTHAQSPRKFIYLNVSQNYFSEGLLTTGNFVVICILKALNNIYYRVSTPPEGANPRFSQVILPISQVFQDPESQVFIFFCHFPGLILPELTRIPGFPRSSQYVNGFIKNWCFLTKIDVYRQKFIFINKKLIQIQPVTQY